MSVEAISWALNLAPVPVDSRGQPSSACKFVLVGLANHAGPDGTGAFHPGPLYRPFRANGPKLPGPTRSRGHHSPCDPAIVAARIKRADQRPQGWDLSPSRVRADFGEAEPTCRPSARQALLTGRLRRAHQVHQDGMQAQQPAADPADHCAVGVQQLHPATRTGCNQHGDGVQSAQPRGAAVAAEPYVEPPAEPSAISRPSLATPTPGGAGDSGSVAEFFTALGTEWQLTAAQRARLTPAVAAALGIGWGQKRWDPGSGRTSLGSATRTRY